LEARGDGFGNRTTGVFHQRQRWRACCNRKPVRLTHLRDGEDFAAHLPKCFSRRATASAITGCFLQNAKRTKCVGPSGPKKALNGTGVTCASRVRRSQNARSGSLLMFLMLAVRKYVPSQGNTSKPTRFRPAASASRFA